MQYLLIVVQMLTHSTSQPISAKIQHQQTIAQRQCQHHRTPVTFMTMTVQPQPVELPPAQMPTSNYQAPPINYSNTLSLSVTQLVIC